MARRSDTLAAQRRRAPRLGEDTDEILSGLLGLSAEEISRLRGEGVV